MKLATFSTVIGICVSLMGCGHISSRLQLRAADLDPTPPIIADPKGSPLYQLKVKFGTETNSVQVDPSVAVHLLVQESQAKCADFVNSMYAEAAGSNTLLDFGSTLTSALATVFTATAVIHPLSASATIFNGTKTSISNNYLNALSIAHIAQAIQDSYNVNMDKYIHDLAVHESENKAINYFAERDRILYYHAQCSLAAAEATLTSRVSKTPEPSSPQSAIFKYSVTSKATKIPNLLADFIYQFSTSPLAAAGVTAMQVLPVPGPRAISGQIQFQMVTPFTLSVQSTGKITAEPKELSETNAVLTIGGSPEAGDSIMITGTPIAKPATSTSGSGPELHPTNPPPAPPPISSNTLMAVPPRAAAQTGK